MIKDSDGFSQNLNKRN